MSFLLYCLNHFLNAFLSVGSASSGNESDVYLASFAKDLEFNFDGREINDMLANFNVADGESSDILHDQPFSGISVVISHFQFLCNRKIENMFVHISFQTAWRMNFCNYQQNLMKWLVVIIGLMWSSFSFRKVLICHHHRSRAVYPVFRYHSH